MKVPINIAKCILIDGNREYHDRCPNQSKQFKSGHYTYPVKSDQTLSGVWSQAKADRFLLKKRARWDPAIFLSTLSEKDKPIRLIKTGQNLIQWSESFTLVWKVLLQTPPQNAQDTCHHFGNCIHGIEGHSRCQSEVQTWPASSKFFFIFAFQNSCIFNEANQVISCVRADNQWTKSCRKTCEKDLDTRSTNLGKVEIAKLWMKTASNICLYVN